MLIKWTTSELLNQALRHFVNLMLSFFKILLILIVPSLHLAPLPKSVLHCGTSESYFEILSLRASSLTLLPWSTMEDEAESNGNNGINESQPLTEVNANTVADIQVNTSTDTTKNQSWGGENDEPDEDGVVMSTNVPAKKKKKKSKRKGGAVMIFVQTYAIFCSWSCYRRSPAGSRSTTSILQLRLRIMRRRKRSTACESCVPAVKKSC